MKAEYKMQISKLNVRSLKLDDIGSTRRSRRGVVMAEAAIVLSVFLTILLGSLDLGLAVLRNNVIAEGARRVARQAAVHGQMAAPESTVWGPTQASGTADDGSLYATALQPVMILVEPADVSYDISWLDGSNSLDDRVQVTVSYSHATSMPLIFGNQPFNLSAVCTMRIVH